MMMLANDMTKLKTMGTDCDELAESMLVASVLFSVSKNHLFLSVED